MNPLMEHIWRSIRAADWFGLFLDVGVKSSAVLLCVWLVLRLLRHASASTRHWIWLVAILSLFLLPVRFTRSPTFAIPIWTSRGPRASQNELGSIIGRSVDKPNPSRGINTPGQQPFRSVRPGVDHQSQSRTQLSLSRLLFLCWVSGLLTSLAWFAAGRVRLRMLRRQGQPLLHPEIPSLLEAIKTQFGIHQQVLLLQSNLCKVPITWGTLRPVIMVPTEAESWTSDLLRLVLSHELAHIKRRDFLAQTAASLISALYWSNPVVWWAARQARLERERACDDMVLNSGARPSTYASQLVALARNFGRWSPIASGAIPMARASQLEHRVTSIVDGTRNRQTLTSKLLLVSLSGVVLLLASISLFRVQAQDKTEDEKFPPRLK